MDNRTSANFHVVLCHLHRVWGTDNCSLIYDDDDDDINDDNVNFPHKNINAQKQKHKHLI